MIGRLTKGRRIRGLISYLLASRDHNNEPRTEAVVVGGTITGDDVYAITAQYTKWLQLNPDATAPVIHESISPTNNDRQLTHAEMAEMGRIWAERMGFSAYTVVSHGDHLHIAALRIKPSGKLLSTWQDWKKSEKIVRGLEEQFGLELVRSSHLLDHERAHTHRRATTKGQAAYIEITGELPPAQRVAAAIDAILADKPTRDEFEQRLAEYGINARANVASTGKLNGYAYEVGGITVTSKAIGRGYTLANLQKRGLDLSGVKKHEQSQQLEATGPRAGAGNPGNPEANQRVASSDRIEPRKNIPGNQRVTGSGTFPGNAPTARQRPADRRGLGSPRPVAHRPQPTENINELVSKENQVMETVSITPTAPGAHLQHLASGPAIHRRAGGNGWWPQSVDDLSGAGLSLSDIEWWRYQPTGAAGSGISEPRLRIGLTDGAEVELRSDGVSASRATPAAEAALVALAQQRGWTSVTLTGSDTVKRRLAREMIERGVSVTNPELAGYCQQIQRELSAPGAETAISVQPVVPARPKLGLAGWRQKKQPASAPVQPAAEAPVQAEPTSHQIDTASPPAPLVPTSDEIESAAQKAGQGDVDGVLSYRTRIDVYKLAELATGDERMRQHYRALLDADEQGYPWRQPVRESLLALEREIQADNLDEAQEKLYDAWLSLEAEELQLVRRYNERVDELREERKHDDIRPS